LIITIYEIGEWPKDFT